MAIPLTIRESGEQVCVNVSVVDDLILENTETFTVRPNSTDQDVIIANSTATIVEITDNDSKSALCW